MLTINKNQIKKRTYRESKSLYFRRFIQGMKEGSIEGLIKHNPFDYPLEDFAEPVANNYNIRAKMERRAFVHGYICGVYVAEYASDQYKQGYNNAENNILRELEREGFFEYIRD